jgi:hypothetical protein
MAAARRLFVKLDQHNTTSILGSMTRWRSASAVHGSSNDHADTIEEKSHRWDLRFRALDHFCIG